jgi:hypothetical protein
MNAEVPEEDIGIIAHDQALLEGLPKADIADKSEVKPALKQGVAVGGATGLVAGLAAAAVPGGFAVGGAALAGMALAGSAFGAWASSLIGVSVPHREVEEFQQAIQDGSLLMIVGTTSINRDPARRIVSENYPDVLYGGEAGEVSAFG